MSRILCIDYGLKRCGLAATDTLQIAVHPIDYIATEKLWAWFQDYMAAEPVEKLVMGDGRHHDGAESQVTHAVMAFAKKVHKNHPNLDVVLVDEAYTSAQAKEVILRSGAKKKTRREKGIVDKISAVLILQRHLGHI